MFIWGNTFLTPFFGIHTSFIDFPLYPGISILKRLWVEESTSTWFSVMTRLFSVFFCGRCVIYGDEE